MRKSNLTARTRRVVLNFNGVQNAAFSGPEKLIGIAVSRAGLDRRAVASLLRLLNAMFSALGVRFTAGSTGSRVIHVGASAQIPYLGLAEIGGATGFVQSDRLNAGELPRAIAHEALHLLGFRHTVEFGTLADCALINIRDKKNLRLLSHEDVVVFAGTADNHFSDAGWLYWVVSESPEVLRPMDTSPGTVALVEMLDPALRVTLNGNLTINGSEAGNSELVGVLYDRNSGLVSFTPASGAGSSLEWPRVEISISNCSGTSKAFAMRSGGELSFRGDISCDALLTGVGTVYFAEATRIEVTGSLSAGCEALELTGLLARGDGIVCEVRGNGSFASASVLYVSGDLYVGGGVSALFTVRDAGSVFSAVQDSSSSRNALLRGRSVNLLAVHAGKLEINRAVSGDSNIQVMTSADNPLAFSAILEAVMAYNQSATVLESTVNAAAWEGLHGITVSGDYAGGVTAEASASFQAKSHPLAYYEDYEDYDRYDRRRDRCRGGAAIAGNIVSAVGFKSGLATFKNDEEFWASSDYTINTVTNNYGTIFGDDFENRFDAMEWTYDDADVVFGGDFSGTVSVASDAEFELWLGGYGQLWDSSNSNYNFYAFCFNEVQSLGIRARDLTISGDFTGTVAADARISITRTFEHENDTLYNPRQHDNRLFAAGFYASGNIAVAGDLSGSITAAAHVDRWYSAGGYDRSEIVESYGIRTNVLTVDGITGTIRAAANGMAAARPETYVSGIRVVELTANRISGTIVAEALSDSAENQVRTTVIGICSDNGILGEGGPDSAAVIGEDARIVAFGNNVSFETGKAIAILSGGTRGSSLSISGTIFAGEKGGEIDDTDTLLEKLDRYRELRYDFTGADAIRLRSALFVQSGVGCSISTMNMSDSATWMYTMATDWITVGGNGVIFGDIDLSAGNNYVDLDSRAQVFGDLGSDLGTLNVEFYLRGDISDGAVVFSSGTDNVTEKSILTFTVNVADYYNGTDETAFDEDNMTRSGVYTLMEGNFTSGWIGRRVTVRYQGEWCSIVINGGEAVFADGVTVSASYVCVDGNSSGGDMESIRLQVSDADTARKTLAGFRVSAQNGAVHLEWTAQTDAVGYIVQYCRAGEDGAADWTEPLSASLFKTGASAVANRVDLTLDSSYSYFFRTSAVYSDGSRSAWSGNDTAFAVGNISGAIAAPTVPTGADALNGGTGFLNGGISGDMLYLNWDDVSCANQVKYYEVQFFTDGESSTPYYTQLVGGTELDGGWTVNLAETELVESSASGRLIQYRRVSSEAYVDLESLNFPDIWWRVRAVDNGGTAGEWSGRTKITPAAVSTAPSEVDGLYFDVQGSIVSFNWNDALDSLGAPASNIQKYLLEYDTHADFSCAVQKEVRSSQLIASGLTNAMTYYWRVKTVDVAGNQSDWVDGNSFKIMVKDNVAPGGVSGILVAVSGNNAGFTWRDATDGGDEEYRSGVHGYVLSYVLTSEITGFESLKAKSVLIDDLPDTEENSVFIGPLSDGEYQWRIRAYDWAGNNSEWYTSTSTSTFTVDTRPEDLSMTFIPDAESGVFCGAAFHWSGDVEMYQLQYSTDSLFANNVESVTVANPNSGKGPIEWSSSTLITGEYYWRVRSYVRPDVVSEFVNGKSFLIDVLPPEWTSLQGGVPLYPVSVIGTTLAGATVTLAWSPAEDTYSNVTYSVSYSINGSETTITGLTDPTYNFFATSNVIDMSRFIWRITATDERGNSVSAVSQELTISLQDDTPPSSVETLQSKISLDGSRYTFLWSAATDNRAVTSYEFQFSDNAEFVDDETFQCEQIEIVSTSIDNDTFRAMWTDAIDTTATYYYRVRALDGNRNRGEWTSSTLDFSDPGKLTLTVSTADEASGTPTTELGIRFAFRWQAISEATGYSLMIADNSDFSDSVTIYQGNGLGYSYVPSNWLALDGKTLYWRVVATDGASELVMDGPSYTVSLLDDSAPEWEEPNLSVVFSDQAAILSWSAAEDPSGPITYTVQYATDWAFTSAKPVPVDGTTGSIEVGGANGLRELTTYYWRVSAADSAGNTTGWVRGEAFTTGDWSAPTTPAAKGSIYYYGEDPTKVTLKWQESTDNSGDPVTYLIEISDSRKFTEISQSITVTDGVPDAKKYLYYTLENIELRTTYYWRVSAIDSSGNVSTPSSVKSFNSAPDAGNSFDDAFAMVLGECHTEEIGGGDSADYYKIDLTDGTAGEFIFTASAGALTLYSEARKKITYKSGDAVRLDGGVYYVAVKSSSSSTFTYDLCVGGDFYPGADRNNTIAQANANPALSYGIDSVRTDWVGYGDPEDYYRLEVVEYAGAFTLAVTSDSASKMAYNAENLRFALGVEKNGEFSTVKSAKYNKKTGLFELSGQLVAGTYYVRVYSADNGKKKNSNYTLTLSGQYYNQRSEADSNTLAEAAVADGLAIGRVVDSWVGCGDPVNYYKFVVSEVPGSYQFVLSDSTALEFAYNLENVKLQVGTVDSKGKFKSVGSAKYSKSTGVYQLDKELAVGTYYIKVYSADNGKKKNSGYELAIGGVRYTLADPTNNTAVSASRVFFGDAPTTGWVGYGDTVDYYELELADAAGCYTFLLGNAEDSGFDYNVKNLKFQLGTVNDKGTFKALASGKVVGDTVSLNDYNLKSGTYYLKVYTSSSSKNSVYELAVGGKIYNADNSDDTLALAQLKTARDISEPITDWVGFGDRIDYQKVDLTAGRYALTLTGVDAGDKLKLTLYDAAGSSLGSLGSSDILAGKSFETKGVVSGVHYVAVKTTDEKKYMSGYSLGIALV